MNITQRSSRYPISKSWSLRLAQEVGNANAQWWSKRLLGALAAGGGAWVPVGLRQLSGMLVLVFARSALRNVLGEVSTASVACGVLGLGGNKGAVALSFTLYRRKLAVFCSHFAAHQVRVHRAYALFFELNGATPWASRFTAISWPLPAATLPRTR